jgi:hypothetical protein
MMAFISAKPFLEPAILENAFPVLHAFEQPPHSDIFGGRPILRG